jgi:hypothetical protein
MSFLFILFLRSSSTKATLIFATVDANHTISLSPDANRSIGSSSFVILVTGSAKDETLFFNNLLRDSVDESFTDFFEVGNLTSRDPLGIPFVPGIQLDRFCKKWGIHCPQASPNTDIVFIAVPIDADKQEDVSRMSVAISSIVSLVIHLAARWQSPIPEWDPVRAVTSRNLLRTEDIKRPFIVVIPEPTRFTNAVEEMSDVHYNRARRAEEVLYSELMQHEFDLDKKSAVFVWPDPVRRPHAYRDSMRDIAEFIGGLVGESEPLAHEDAIAVFQNVANWLGVAPNDPNREITVDKLIYDRIDERFQNAQDALVNKSIAWAEQDLTREYQAFKVHFETETDAAARTVIDEFRLELSQCLRNLFDRAGLAMPFKEDLKRKLTGNISSLWANQRNKIVVEFSSNRLKNRRALILEAKTMINQFLLAIGYLENRLIGRFLKIVDFDALPEEMQITVTRAYDDSLAGLTEELNALAAKARSGLPGTVYFVVAFVSCLLIRKMNTVEAAEDMITSLCNWIPLCASVRSYYQEWRKIKTAPRRRRALLLELEALISKLASLLRAINRLHGPLKDVVKELAPEQCAQRTKRPVEDGVADESNADSGSTG